MRISSGIFGSREIMDTWHRTLDKVKTEKVTGTCQTDLTSLRSSLELITYFDGTQLILGQYRKLVEVSEKIWGENLPTKLV